jgi:SAM-dependent methyltransferase
VANDDQIKWDRKYTENTRLRELRDPCRDLVAHHPLAPNTLALDVACGIGRNAIFLAKEGFEVDAVDISAVALQELTQHLDAITDLRYIHTALVDLDTYAPLPHRYGIIIMNNYLDRLLIPKLADALVKDGILIIDTYMDDEANGKPATNPDFLLQPGELPTLFNPDNFETVSYREYWSEGVELYRMRKGAIVVRRR